MDKNGSVLGVIDRDEEWKRFIQYKEEHQHLNEYEARQLKEYVDNKKYVRMKKLIEEHKFPGEFPVKKIVNKEGTEKKRVVYSFSDDVSITLKFIAFQLYKFDDIFSSNCYAFRREYGVGDALRRILRNKKIQNMYCLKADISNYFNSIDVQILLEKLDGIKQRDLSLYQLFEQILSEDRVIENNRIVSEHHGAMAGIPIAPFFANIYLMELDNYFEEQGTEYFRYSDDILLFADTYDALMMRKHELYGRLQDWGLTINPEKEHISVPGETWEFLGFSYDNGQFDLSANTKRKIKAKIKRKADALRRWRRKKGLSPDKAAIGFVRAMNRKFYGGEGRDDFTWSRWFFPNLTVDHGLKEIDKFMQDYIRYTVTGRHYKGNYRITYQQLKEWGYRSLVHEYYVKKQQLPIRENMN